MLIGTFFSKSISRSSCPKRRGKMGLFEVLVKRELTLERLQLSNSNPLLAMLYAYPRKQIKWNSNNFMCELQFGYFQNRAHLAPPSTIPVTNFHTFLDPSFWSVTYFMDGHFLLRGTIYIFRHDQIRQNRHLSESSSI